MIDYFKRCEAYLKMNGFEILASNEDDKEMLCKDGDEFVVCRCIDRTDAPNFATDEWLRDDAEASMIRLIGQIGGCPDEGFFRFDEVVHRNLNGSDGQERCLIRHGRGLLKAGEPC